MYVSGWNYVQTKYGNDVQLCLTGINLLLYDIKCDEIYQDTSLNANTVYFSDYPATVCSTSQTKEN